MSSMKEKTNKTLDYYNQQSQNYSNQTLDLKLSTIQDYFLSFLQPDALILDFGCGSGRDTKYFLDQGYRVEAIDGSEEMVKIASKNTGIQVRQMLFNELNEVERYDGIFACASILHVPFNDLPGIFKRMKIALKDTGIIYVSFKYGDFEGHRGERYYTDLTEERLTDILDSVKGLSIISKKITTSVIPGRDEKWLNVILSKKSSI